MMTENEGSTVGVSSEVNQQLVQADLVRPVPERTDTAKSPAEKGRTVRSSQTHGSVWLRFTPRPPQAGKYDLSTED